MSEQSHQKTTPWRQPGKFSDQTKRVTCWRTHTGQRKDIFLRQTITPNFFQGRNCNEGMASQPQCVARHRTSRRGLERHGTTAHIGFRREGSKTRATTPMQPNPRTTARKEESQNANQSRLEICRATKKKGQKKK